MKRSCQPQPNTKPNAKKKLKQLMYLLAHKTSKKLTETKLRPTAKLIPLQQDKNATMPAQTLSKLLSGMLAKKMVSKGNAIKR